MLAIARGLMANPEIIMLDEPSLGLAPLIVNDIIRIIQEINRKGVSVLLVEQNAKKALAIADRACVLEQGRIVKRGGVLVVAVVIFKPSGLMGNKEFTIYGLLRRIKRLMQRNRDGKADGGGQDE